MDWWFDPARTYEDNVENGPFGTLARPPRRQAAPVERRETFLGLSVHSPFGIAAGPLPTSRHCAAAFQHGFDVNVYKTVRSRAHPAHPFPNTLAVRVTGELAADAAVTVAADSDLASATSISNSYGVPSPDPDQWQPDMAAAAAAAAEGQVLIGSCQGTRSDDVDLVEDFVRTAGFVAETGVGAVELNLSCPNEGTSALLCFDVATVARIAESVKVRVGDVPVILKIAYFRDADALARLVAAVAPVVAGIAAINTLPARLVDAAGDPALPGAGRETAGVCGEAIRWAGLDMVRRLARLRDVGSHDWAIIGVGGVLTAADYGDYRQAGADAVMTATGAMRNPGLGTDVRALAG